MLPGAPPGVGSRPDYWACPTGKHASPSPPRTPGLERPGPGEGRGDQARASACHRASGARRHPRTARRGPILARHRRLARRGALRSARAPRPLARRRLDPQERAAHRAPPRPRSRSRPRRLPLTPDHRSPVPRSPPLPSPTSSRARRSRRDARAVAMPVRSTSPCSCNASADTSRSIRCADGFAARGAACATSCSTGNGRAAPGSEAGPARRSPDARHRIAARRHRRARRTGPEGPRGRRLCGSPEGVHVRPGSGTFGTVRRTASSRARFMGGAPRENRLSNGPRCGGCAFGAGRRVEVRSPSCVNAAHGNAIFNQQELKK